MSIRARRSLTAIALTMLALLGLIPVPHAAASDDLTIAQAEAKMLVLLNEDRARHGLRPYRADARLARIARDRSWDMAVNDYFAHQRPDGQDVFDILSRSGFTWYAAGEILAWNSWPTLDDATRVANEGWLDSPSHRAIVLSDDYNYVGIGLVVDPDDGHKIWTALAMRGPDRTGGWSRMSGAQRTRPGTSTSVPVAVAWTGGDIKLQVLTAGFHSYQVQRRIDGGSWRTVWTTTASKVTSWHTRHHRYEYRIRAIDRRGNAGPWSASYPFYLP